MESYWSSKYGGYIKCPVEGCNHIGIIITEAHSRLEHGMSREEVREKYGLPKNVSKLKNKLIQKMLQKQRLKGVKTQ